MRRRRPAELAILLVALLAFALAYCPPGAALLGKAAVYFVGFGDDVSGSGAEDSAADANVMDEDDAEIAGELDFFFENDSVCVYDEIPVSAFKTLSGRRNDLAANCWRHGKGRGACEPRHFLQGLIEGHEEDIKMPQPTFCEPFTFSEHLHSGSLSLLRERRLPLNASRGQGHFIFHNDTTSPLIFVVTLARHTDGREGASSNPLLRSPRPKGYLTTEVIRV